MVSVSIVGYGNIGSHLCAAFNAANHVMVDQLITRQEVDLPISIFHTISEVLPSSDVYLLCVPDGLIPSISNQLQYYLPPSSFICHVSGTGNLDLIDPYFKNRGIFYPLQTFSKHIEMRYDTIPFLIQASPNRAIKKLRLLVEAIGATHYDFTAEQKKSIHLAAVIVNNFTNALYQEAYSLLNGEDIPPEILLPLINQTVEKLEHTTPLAAQTGPARRNDAQTINAQLERLDQKSEMQKIYALLTELIQKQHKHSS